MTTDAILAVFENFNEPRDEPPVLVPDEPPQPAEDAGEIRAAAWTDGYMTGRQEAGFHDGDQPLTAKLLTSLYELDAKTSESVDEASLAVADLLVSTVIAVTSDDWSGRLLERVRMVADRIKPALTVAPEFMLRDESGRVQHFGDITELARALEAGNVGEGVTIRWHHGEATISRTALLEDLREAIIPLSAGLVNEHSTRHHT